MSTQLRQHVHYIQQITTWLNRLAHDIKTFQGFNDLSLNIYAEDFFRDVLNDIWGYNLKNANTSHANTPYIDLVDTDQKVFIQVTAAQSLEKLKHSLKVLKIEGTEGYEVRMLYLIEKPKHRASSLAAIASEFSIGNLQEKLYDKSDLLNDIRQLHVTEVAQLYQTYFQNLKEVPRYTKEETLQMVIEHLIKNYNPDLDFDFDAGLTNVHEKLKLNSIQELPLLYRKILTGLENAHNLDLLNEVDRLKIDALVKEIYAKILVKAIHLKKRQSTSSIEINLNQASISDLHGCAVQIGIEFPKLIKHLFDDLRSKLDHDQINPNAIDSIWTIIAAQFEICEIGRKS
ncbi:MAG: SMEK domain-containing protein [Shewanellaceae bacterium]|nr:SMEK domain-containing protein [Shewanellaceae bacterium]